MALFFSPGLTTALAANTPQAGEGEKASLIEGRDQDGKSFKLADFVG